MRKAAVSLLVLVATASVADDITYREHIAPLWQARCSACHGPDSPYLGEFQENEDAFVARDKGPRMDTYADLITFIGWPDTGALMRRLDDGTHTPDGTPGNMYVNLGADEDERQKNLALFKAWVGEGGWILKRWDARGDVPAVTKEELDRIEVKY